MKCCSKCKINKSLSDFYKCKRSKDGFKGVCKSCCKIYNQQPFRLEAGRKASAKYKNKNKEKVRLQSAGHHLGISGEVRDKFIKSHGEKCEVCGITREESRTLFGKDLCIDHSHVTNKLCGVLCICCNSASGKLKDDIYLSYRLLLYLERTRKEEFCE